jgi:Glycosyl transferases group 1
LTTFDERAGRVDRAPPAAVAAPGRAAVPLAWSAADVSPAIVHLLGDASDNMVAFFAAVTTALAEGGLRQTVVLLDDAGQRHLLPLLHASVRLVLVPRVAGQRRRGLALLQALADETRRAPSAAVHLHGVLPCLLGGYAARFRGLRAPLFFTPYGKGLSRPLNGAAALLLRVLRPPPGAPARRTITSRATEVEALRRLTGEPVDLVEGSVPDLFFETPRREARHPLIATAQRANDPRAAALYAQLAVLLGEESLRLSFNWIGPTDAPAKAQLEAAGVGIFPSDDEAACARRLQSAWLYLAIGDAARFPACLVEAMAMGLPCVAWDTPLHREVLRHGETGLLCSSDTELLACVARLVDSADERLRLGQAARAEAQQRFHRRSFSAALLAAYGAEPGPGP